MKKTVYKTCDSIINCQENKILLFKKNGLSVMECKKCNHRFAKIDNIENHTEQVYSDYYFFGDQQGYPDYLDNKDILYKAGLRYAKIVAKHTNPGKVLDVGCAAGFILKGFEKSGWSCYGIEPNDRMASYGRNELNLNITTGSLETFQANEKFDLVNLIQVIGHFYDLDKAIKNISDLLTTNGLVLIESWNRKSIYARIMGKGWHEYIPPSVIHWFSDKTLTQIFNFYGFQLIAKGYPLKRINISHALSILKGKSSNSVFKRRFINLLNKTVGKLTLIYPPLDLKWYIFRKRNITIAGHDMGNI
ncbi:MAG TPA: class I SAM-dependent methyltransferase [Chitinophagaceae bacterium]|nr:class I SAM-dependent methyltransferase [Chitinophagaceae bacterium]